MSFREARRRATTALPALEDRRGVSHTPIKRPGRGERLSDGRVPVGRMRYAPTSGGIPALGFRGGERFFAPTPVRKGDCPKSVIHPPLGFRRGVSHTPIKRPDRGERLSDGRVPVGRMRVRPTSGGIPALGFRRGERFFAPTPVRKGYCPKSIIHPPLGFRRGVSHTPIKRPGRGERLFDGRVPVGRMRYAPTSGGIPALGFRRGVSHTPPKPPDRGERLSDGRVPVGRMRYAPTSGGIPALGFRRGERFFAPTPVRKAHCNPSTALTFWGKQISCWRQRLLFEGSKFPAGDSAYFLGEADFRSATALTFWGKQISGRRQHLLFGGSKFPAGDGIYFLGEANFRPATALTFWGKMEHRPSITLNH